jgi:hypothetical protein
MRLVKESQIANRQDLVEAAERLADFIQDYLDRGKPVPIINIIGSVGGGKSLFWDFVTQKLLGSSAIFLKGKSESYQRNGHDNERLYETWTKLDVGKNEHLSLFLCNVRAVFRNVNQLDVESLESGEYQKFGDVLIFTNAHQGFIPDNVPQLELAITVTSKNPTAIFPSQLAYACNF